MNPFAVIWLVALVVFLLIEASTVTVVSLWFAAGSLVAMIAALLGLEFWLQAVVFAVVSIALLLCLRPVLRRYFTPKLVRTNADSLIGTQGMITAAVDNIAATGKVKLGAMEWSARSTDGQPIPEGTLVTVDKIEGAKVLVTPAPVSSEIS